MTGGAHRIGRLKLLKDEITKDYFIKLKAFLWDEGVRGPDDPSPNFKVYPSRAYITPLLASARFLHSHTEFGWGGV